jgi:beta-mannosidase
MKTIRDLGSLSWRLSPSVPHFWEFAPFATLDDWPEAEPIPARVPGSVQAALRAAGILPDWNVGRQARACEWVENRHWIYETLLPDEWFAGDAAAPTAARRHTLVCRGLDYAGWVYLNGKLAGGFRGSHVPHRFDLEAHLAPSRNVLRIVFDLPPRWLGQFGRTSRFTDWKVRFNYTWDWTPRLVQVGFTDAVLLETSDGAEIADFRCAADAEIGPGRFAGLLAVRGRVPAGWGTVRLTLSGSAGIVREERMSAVAFAATGFAWRDLAVEPWQPNLSGSQPLYAVTCELLDDRGTLLDHSLRRVGFRRIAWRPCEGAPPGADPWLCVVNGEPVFLQGVNYPPVLPNWADVTREQHRKLLATYRDLGVNVLRINACGYLESADFYDLCDEMGLLVWQEFPLTSSGVENTPPSDPRSIGGMTGIARSFIVRRQHHASLLMWGGGNELLDKDMKPYDLGHPMLAALARVVEEEDPARRYVPTSPSGPRWGIEEPFIGKGLHWDVHGPWKPKTDLAEWTEFWRKADALFYSEIGAPGAAPADLIKRYAGELAVMPIEARNPLYCLTLSWWTEDARFVAEHGGRPPRDLEEYVAWSQRRQADTLAIAVKACKDRFPACGGAILWCGHDCFPCAVNTSIIDFDGNPKPAALALRGVWRSPA